MLLALDFITLNLLGELINLGLQGVIELLCIQELVL